MSYLWDSIIWFFAWAFQGMSSDFPAFASENPVVVIFVVAFVFIWIIAILWTLKDISARTNSFFWQLLSILLVWLGSPLIWLPLYLLLRPLRYKWDRIWWRESMVSQVSVCPTCGIRNPLHHDFCAACGQKMVVDCKECKTQYHWVYDYCPHCGGPNIE